MNIKLVNFLISSWIFQLKDQPPVEPKIDFAVGGQAVMEGVMMRSPNHVVIAVRKSDQSIKVKKEKYRTLIQRRKYLNVPILRGLLNLFEMMYVGAKAINFSANEMMDNDLTDEEREQMKNRGFWGKLLEVTMFVFSFVVAIALTLFLFKFMPLWIATIAGKYSSYVNDHYIVFNMIDGVTKMLIFLSYIFLLTLFKSFRRIFEFHGAEHKSIFTYENKLPLTVENAKKQTRFHPRCGTSFILIVFTISIIVYTAIPKQPEFWQNLVIRIALLPLIAGISYEYLKISAKYCKNIFVKALIAPGLWYQRLTTREPDSLQLEVGLKSLSTALELENSK